MKMTHFRQLVPGFMVLCGGLAKPSRLVLMLIRRVVEGFLGKLENQPIVGRIKQNRVVFPNIPEKPSTTLHIIY